MHPGDWIDCYSISQFTKDPTRVSRLKDEIDATCALREELDSLGAARKIFLRGNHEARMPRFINANVPALLGLIDFDGLLGLPQNGWRVVPYQRHGSIGKLHVTHDSDRTGVYSMRQTAIDYCASVAFGHTHYLGAWYFGDVLGNRHVSLNVGWLGDREQIDYRHRVKTKDWQHGIGRVQMRADGTFQAEPIPILDGRAILQ